MTSTTWRINSSAGVFVAKTGRLGGKFEHGLEVAAAVEASGIRAGAPIRTGGGELTTQSGDGRMCLLQFVPGRPIDASNPTDARAWGRTLACVHHILAGRDDLGKGLERLPLIDLDAPHLGIEPWIRPAIAPVLDDLLAFQGTFGVLHGDPSAEEFLLEEETQTVGVIDWGAVWWGPLLYDLASARMYAGAHAFAHVLAGYSERSPVRAAEFKALDLFLRFRWCVQAAYFSWRAANDIRVGIEDPSENREGLADARRHLASW
jgi:Ser/Thr protein kinase RdoA (MazF antagonist)